AARGLKNFKTEEASDHGRGRKHFLSELAQPRQSPRDDQPDAGRRVQFANLEFGAKLARRIVQPILLFEMPEQFLDKEWIAVGLGEYLGNHGRRRRFSAQAVQHRADFTAWQAFEAHSRRQPPAE